MSNPISRYAIYGCEGCAREVLPLLRRQHLRNYHTDPDIIFVDDNPLWRNKIVNGVKVVNFQDLCNERDRNRLISVAIANPETRSKIVNNLVREEFSFLTIIAQTCDILDCNDIGEGGIFCGNTIVTSNTKIGKHFHCNNYSYVAHDCVIGDFVTFAPRVCCNGRVIIGDFAYIGTGAMFKQGTQDKPLIVGSRAVVGMGAVVTKDVPPGATVVGNPARAIGRKG